MVCGILLAEKKFTPNFFSCRANRSTLKKFQIFIIFLCVKFIPFRVLFFTRLELVLKGHFWTLGGAKVPPSQSLIKSWKNTPCFECGWWFPKVLLPFTRWFANEQILLKSFLEPPSHLLLSWKTMASIIMEWKFIFPGIFWGVVCKKEIASVSKGHNLTAATTTHKQKGHYWERSIVFEVSKNWEEGLCKN